MCLKKNFRESNIEVVLPDLLVVEECFTVLQYTGIQYLPLFGFIARPLLVILQVTYFDSLSEGPSWTVIGVVVGIVVLGVTMAGLVTWWFCKKKKSRKNSKM